MSRAAPATAALALALVCGTASGLAGQAGAGAQLHWGSEQQVGLGLRALGRIPNAGGLHAMGSFDIFFPSGAAEYWEVNANLFYGLPGGDLAGWRPYALAGLNVNHTDIARVDETHVGLNLGGGLRLPGAVLRPFFETRYVFTDQSQLVLSAGVLLGDVP